MSGRLNEAARLSAELYTVSQKVHTFVLLQLEHARRL